jgi:hypothetical protein
LEFLPDQFYHCGHRLYICHQSNLVEKLTARRFPLQEYSRKDDQSLLIGSECPQVLDFVQDMQVEIWQNIKRPTEGERSVQSMGMIVRL